MITIGIGSCGHLTLTIIKLLIRTPPLRWEMLSHCGKAGSLIVVGDVVYRNAQDILDVEVPTHESGHGGVIAVALSISRWTPYDSS